MQRVKSYPFPISWRTHDSTSWEDKWTPEFDGKLSIQHAPRNDFEYLTEIVPYKPWGAIS